MSQYRVSVELLHPLCCKFAGIAHNQAIYDTGADNTLYVTGPVSRSGLSEFPVRRDVIGDANVTRGNDHSPAPSLVSFAGGRDGVTDQTAGTH